MEGKGEIWIAYKNTRAAPAVGRAASFAFCGKGFEDFGCCSPPSLDAGKHKQTG